MANQNFVQAAANIAADPLRTLWLKAWGAAAVTPAAMALMWIFNVNGDKIDVLWVAAISILLTIFFGLRPIMQVYAVGVGGLVSVLTGKSPNRTIPETLQFLYKAILWEIVVLIEAGAILATIGFGPRPSAFWGLAFIVFGLTAVGMATGSKGMGWTKLALFSTLFGCALIWFIDLDISIPIKSEKTADAMEMVNESETPTAATPTHTYTEQAQLTGINCTRTIGEKEFVKLYEQNKSFTLKPGEVVCGRNATIGDYNVFPLDPKYNSGVANATLVRNQVWRTQGSDPSRFSDEYAWTVAEPSAIPKSGIQLIVGRYGMTASEEISIRNRLAKTTRSFAEILASTE